MKQELLRLIGLVGAAVEPWSSKDSSVVTRQLTDVVELWLNRFSPHTIRAYVGDWRKWTSWLSEATLVDSPFAPSMLSAYLSHQRDYGAGAHTVARRAESLKTLFRDLGLLTGPRKQELAMIVRHCGVRRRPSCGLPAIPKDLLDRIDRCIDPSNPRDVRDAALAALFLDTFARPSDILGLYEHETWVVPPVGIADLTRCRDGSGRLKIRSLDSRRSDPTRSIFIPCRTMVRIEAWLSISGLTTGALFRTFRYRTCVREDSPPYPANRLRDSLQRIGKLAGVRHRLSLSALRASTANLMLDAGIHMDDVRRAVGTSRLESVARLHSGRHTGGSGSDVLRELDRLRRPRLAKATCSPSPQLVLPGL